jgi:hypothetical protein
MSRKRLRPRSTAARGFDVHIAGFLAGVAKAGDAEKTQHDKRRALVPFSLWVRHAEIPIKGLDEGCVVRFLAHRSRPRCAYRDPARAALHQFLEYLRVSRIVPPRRATLSPADLLVRQYLDHLSASRGLCSRSIEVYAPFVRAFVMAQRLPKGLASIDASLSRRTWSTAAGVVHSPSRGC